MVVVDWPESSVPLLVPKEWQAKAKQQKQQQCVWEYQAEDNLLKLLTHDGSDNNTTVIDVLDPDDIIGVSVEINTTTLLSSTIRAATTTTTSSRSESSDTTTNNNNDDDDNRPANAPSTDALSDTQGHAVLVIYAYPREDPKHPVTSSSSFSFLHKFCGLGSIHPKPNPQYKRPSTEEVQTWGSRYPFHRRLQVVASEDVGPLNALVRAIRQAAQIEPSSLSLEDNNNNNNIDNKERRALVMINPFSGPNRNAEDMYDRIVQPILEQASIEHDVCVTTHAHHATERMAPSYSKNNNHDNNKGNDKDISEYTAVIAIGGDGILYECLQGIHFRDDAQTLLEQLSFGIVGAGTSNGMAKSIARSSHERSSILDASFLIAKGKTKAADLSVYQTRTHNPQNAAGDNSYLSFLTFNWGMVAAIDIDSEVLRSLGSLRFDLWGVWCVLKLKGYKAKFSYLPPTAEYKKNPQGTKELPPLTEALPEKDGWVTEEDDYVIFWPSHGTFASIDDCSFFFMMLLC